MLQLELDGIADIIIDEEKGKLVEKENEIDLANSIMNILKLENEGLKSNLDNVYGYCFDKYNIVNTVHKHYKVL